MYIKNFISFPKLTLVVALLGCLLMPSPSKENWQVALSGLLQATATVFAFFLSGYILLFQLTSNDSPKRPLFIKKDQFLMFSAFSVLIISADSLCLSMPENNILTTPLGLSVVIFSNILIYAVAVFFSLDICSKLEPKSFLVEMINAIANSKNAERERVVSDVIDAVEDFINNAIKKEDSENLLMGITYYKKIIADNLKSIPDIDCVHRCSQFPIGNLETRLLIFWLK